MASFSNFWQELPAKYKNFVSENPEAIGTIESLVRISSYLIPGGKTGDSSVLSELLFSTSSLLTLVNDAILRKAANIKVQVPVAQKQLMTCLSVLEYIEVFLELAAGKYGGSSIRWAIVVCVHLAKAALRLLLLLRHDGGVLSSPPIPTLKRSKDLKEYMKKIHQEPSSEEEQAANDLEMFDEEETRVQRINKDSPIYTLRRSGRVVRSLRASPPVAQRNWRLPHTDAPQDEGIVIVPTPTKLDSAQQMGEGLHAVRPLLHLLSMYMFGEKSVKPWLIACGVDVSSLALMGEPTNLNRLEKGELKRRTILMLLYLLRSPFYDRFSQAKLLFALHLLADKIPGLGIIMNPLIEYLHYWQRIYFYVWMS